MVHPCGFPGTAFFISLEGVWAVRGALIWVAFPFTDWGLGTEN